MQKLQTPRREVPVMNTDKNKASKGTLRRISGFLRGNTPAIVLSIMLSGCKVAAALALPYLFGEAIDLIAGVGITNIAEVKNELIKVVIICLACAVAMWVINTVNNRITLTVARKIRNKTCEKLNRLPISYIDSTPTGETVSRITNDTEKLSDGLLLGFTNLFSGILTILGTLVLMFTVSIKIGLAVMLLTPLSLFAAKFITSRTHGYFTQQVKTLGEETAFVNEKFAEAGLINIFGAENSTHIKFSEINGRLAKTSLNAIFFSSLTNPVTRFVNALVYATVAFIGGVAVISGGGFTVGMLTCMLTYATNYTKPFNEITEVIAELQGSLAGAERILSLLDETEIDDSEKIRNFEAKGGIEFRNVCFGYTEDTQVIKGVSFKAQPGQSIAIVGKTGCGKTTLINLLMRFYDCSDGEILLDGVNTNDISKHALRENFGIVLQDTYVFAGTVRDNITLGNHYSEEEIINAAENSHAWSFIKRLPEGLNTPVGENGSGLSAGQKQLLCITRVMLANPRILLLDEATSSVDTGTEIRIGKAFDRLSQGRTSIIVAHRLSTIRNADLILVMDGGRIIEQGSHSELIKKNGRYAEMLRNIS